MNKILDFILTNKYFISPINSSSHHLLQKINANKDFPSSNDYCIFKCPLGYFYDPLSYSCHQCQPHCHKCQDMESCDLCQPGYSARQEASYDSHSGGQNQLVCLKGCRNGFYQKRYSGKCSECNQFCRACIQQSGKSIELVVRDHLKATDILPLNSSRPSELEVEEHRKKLTQILKNKGWCLSCLNPDRGVFFLNPYFGVCQQSCKYLAGEATLEDIIQYTKTHVGLPIDLKIALSAVGIRSWEGKTQDDLHLQRVCYSCIQHTECVKCNFSSPEICNECKPGYHLTSEGSCERLEETSLYQFIRVLEFFGSIFLLICLAAVITNLLTWRSRVAGKSLQKKKVVMSILREGSMMKRYLSNIHQEMNSSEENESGESQSSVRLKKTRTILKKRKKLKKSRASVIENSLESSRVKSRI